jgi:outer membrane protein assembly factor BamB
LNARHTGNFTEAVELLRKVRKLSGQGDPLEAAAAIADLEAYLATARRLKNEATFYRNAGRFEQAHALLAELMAGYANSPEAHGVGLPVLINSEPPKARILLGGKPVRIGTDNVHVKAETPFVLDLPPDVEVELTLELDGYVRKQLQVRGSKQQTIHARLSRSVDQATILPFELVQPLATDGSRIFAPLASGRVAALDAASLEVDWIRELPELADAVGPATAADGRLLVPVSLNKLVLLSPEDGLLLGELEVPGRPDSQAVSSGDRVAVRTMGGGVAVGPLSGPALALLALPSAVTSGPVALKDGRFAVGCQDGKVWICAGNGSLTSLFNPSQASGKATALLASGEMLLMGDEAGSVHVFEAGRPDRVETIAALPGRPITTIATAGRAIIAGNGSGFARIDLDRLEVTATVSDGNLTVLGSSESQIVSSREDGLILLHRAEGLEEIGRFDAEAGLHLSGLLLGERAVFPAGGGKVVAIFLPRR